MFFFGVLTQPPTVVRKLKRILHTAYTFLHFWRRFTCYVSRCLVTKFLHWSSGGSLLRLRCWLGSTNQFPPPPLPLFLPPLQGGNFQTITHTQGERGARPKKKSPKLTECRVLISSPPPPVQCCQLAAFMLQTWHNFFS